MRQLAVFMLVLALGATAAVALASCGTGEDAKLLPGTTAAEITENLDLVKQLAGEEECVGAADAAQEVSNQIEALGGVDAKLKQALQSGAERLNEVVATCEEAPAEAIAPSTEAPTVEDERVPPGQAKKAEKELEKEAEKEAKEEEKAEKEELPEEETTTTSPEETTTTPPPSESGGTGASGGVSPGAPVGEGE